jgi:hypothetical protein
LPQRRLFGGSLRGAHEPFELRRCRARRATAIPPRTSSAAWLYQIGCRRDVSSLPRSIPAPEPFDSTLRARRLANTGVSRMAVRAGLHFHIAQSGADCHDVAARATHWRVEVRGMHAFLHRYLSSLLELFAGEVSSDRP